MNSSNRDHEFEQQKDDYLKARRKLEKTARGLLDILAKSEDLQQIERFREAVSRRVAKMATAFEDSRQAMQRLVNNAEHPTPVLLSDNVSVREDEEFCDHFQAEYEFTIKGVSIVALSLVFNETFADETRIVFKNERTPAVCGPQGEGGIQDSLWFSPSWLNFDQDGTVNFAILFSDDSFHGQNKFVDSLWNLAHEGFVPCKEASDCEEFACLVAEVMKKLKLLDCWGSMMDVPGYAKCFFKRSS